MIIETRKKLFLNTIFFPFFSKGTNIKSFHTPGLKLELVQSDSLFLYSRCLRKLQLLYIAFVCLEWLYLRLGVPHAIIFSTFLKLENLVEVLNPILVSNYFLLVPLRVLPSNILRFSFNQFVFLFYFYITLVGTSSP